ncbi:CREB-regulated transcription coactivator 3-like isoform X10 [Daktulosphaira vitifoliae]|uniref:CREB-regulated transcription coactivator 3-like isoform X10 n=1 Tax=Daktulosphaira vitifoliae TaxID=58002 RepID=UPI0021AA7859|nr:CREB-regulated transcription coactivator 3-like isoform X10 [Daktulosphaira vitifoliae]
MANPRKFSEKIALHNQKQAEETAAFEKIMREVSVATCVKALANGSEEIVTDQNPEARVRPVGYRERGRSVGSVGPMRSEKRSTDKSPYSSGPYLSPPPPDSGWRRTNSDSALHNSVLQSTSTESVAHLHSPGSQRRTLIDNQQYEKKKYLSTSPDRRPRSCCEVPRVPGINIYTTQQEPGVVQIPIGNNTGSLPDLTNFQFSPPIHAPLDQDDQYNLPSPYNSNGFTVDNSPGNNNTGESCNGSINMHILQPNSNLNYVVGQRNGIKIEPMQTLIYHQHVPLSPAQQQCSPIDSQNEINSSHMNMGSNQHNNINSLGTYRNQSNRPSPQSSPGLTIQYGSSSPVCNSPQSPSSPSSSVSSTQQNQNYQTQKDFYTNQVQANTLQQHFEQFTMQDWNQLIQTLKESNSTAWMAAQLQLDSPVSTGLEYIGSPTNNTYLSQTDDYVNSELTADPGYFSTSPSQSLQYPNQTHTTPNTPSSIPDIILTDFSNGDQLDTRNDFVKGLNCSNSFETDFFSNDESLRQGLADQIDLEHLQMLADSDIDAVTNNDHFRLVNWF